MRGCDASALQCMSPPSGRQPAARAEPASLCIPEQPLKEDFRFLVVEDEDFAMGAHSSA